MFIHSEIPSVKNNSVLRNNQKGINLVPKTFSPFKMAGAETAGQDCQNTLKLPRHARRDETAFSEGSYLIFY